jgi:hypothetical protein
MPMRFALSVTRLSGDLPQGSNGQPTHMQHWPRAMNVFQLRQPLSDPWIEINDNSEGP